MSGVPRTIQTSVRVSHLSGLKRLMEQKDSSSPSGSAPASVTAKSLSVCKKPPFMAPSTVLIITVLSFP